MAKARSNKAGGGGIDLGNLTDTNTGIGSEAPGGNEGGVSIVDPATAASDAGADLGGTAGDSPRAKRTYTRRNSGGGGAEKTAPLDLTIISTSLFTIHMMMAARFEMPELELSEKETDQLGAKIHQLQKVFDVEVNPKTKALVEFAITFGTIYGSMGYNIYERKQKEKAKALAHVGS